MNGEDRLQEFIQKVIDYGYQGVKALAIFAGGYLALDLFFFGFMLISHESTMSLMQWVSSFVHSTTLCIISVLIIAFFFYIRKKKHEQEWW